MVRGGLIFFNERNRGVILLRFCSGSVRGNFKKDKIISRIQIGKRDVNPVEKKKLFLT